MVPMGMCVFWLRIRRTAALLAAAAIFSWPSPARADEVAPELEGADLRAKAQAELRVLFGSMARNDQRRLIGAYVAFDANVSDPSAQVACDDDGDYVVVMSDAMLRLVAHVALAASHDEANGTRKIDEYASFVARSRVPGRRLLPPPPGFYTASTPARTSDERLREGLAFVLARELTHLRAGDLVCPRPTATKESGDDVWTGAEQRKASETAAIVYPGRFIERDNEATVRLLEAGRSELGAMALLRFFVQLEAERVVAIGQVLPTYARQHPSAVTRAAVVKQAADARRRNAGDAGL